MDKLFKIAFVAGAAYIVHTVGWIDGMTTALKVTNEVNEKKKEDSKKEAE